MLPYLSMFVLVSFTAGGTLRAPSVSLNAGQGIHGPRSIDQELDHLTGTHSEPAETDPAAARGAPQQDSWR
jgi:hypothetical protein